ncbi:ABC transporter substrate-binding protein [Mesorhizobium sp. M7A.F.Ca.US.006.01.1.1]|uniref:ABC transporter substrate-binding protein n=1 Tax=Mesorhizobium sp. M7A.F.Ca.US.006.01.1.1 TaxID=2496707 RepID=UPI000FCB0BD6|nr:ABC transporter substrate-binding protein [Mesorhizobium sp. M7A.F.Ca.US.006.01.1.1]RUZ73484.1 ABC transporter substrate-binding protein [Mesorhizobium sp. M7A.F.Ca.US.006.01.1.1]
MGEMEYWKQQVAKGRISRREFLGRLAALGVIASVADTMLLSAGFAAEPKKGGHAKFGVSRGSTTDSNDPAAYIDEGTQFPLWGTLSSSLTEVDAKGNIQPDLAESFEFSNNAATWAFKVRKGATFHNGKDVTAEDVTASIRHHMGPDSKSAMKAVLASVKNIRADDKSTVIFELESGNADFPYLVSDPHLPIMPANPDGSADFASNIRSGPFVFESWEPGVRARLKRNPNFYDTGAPHFDEVEFITITDVSARVNALTTGEVHWINNPDLKTLSLLQRRPGIKINEVKGYGHYVFTMDTTAKPLDDVNVRMALKWAMDREEIAKKVFLGHAVPGNDNPIASTVKFAADPLPRYQYDVDKAKFYLKKAGLTTLNVDLSVAETAFTGAIDAAVLYQESAKKAGININVIREANDGYWNNVFGKKPWVADYWSGRPTIDLLFSEAYAKGAPSNAEKWANPRFNELLVQARGETDDAKRAVMYAEMQQLVHDDAGQVVMVFNNFVEAHSDKLAHGDVASNWGGDGLKIAKRWWFA